MPKRRSIKNQYFLLAILYVHDHINAILMQYGYVTNQFLLYLLVTNIQCSASASVLPSTIETILTNSCIISVHYNKFGTLLGTRRDELTSYNQI